MVPADVQRGGYLRVGSGAERNVVKIFDEVGEAADVFMPTRLPRRKLTVVNQKSRRLLDGKDP